MKKSDQFGKKTWSAPQVLAVSSAKNAAVGISNVNLDLNLGDTQAFIS